MFAQCEGALLSLVAELCGGDELKAVDVLKAPEAKDQVLALVRSIGLSGFDVDELVIGIGEFWCDKNIRNRLIHDEWYPSLLTPGLVGTRSLTRTKAPRSSIARRCQRFGNWDRMIRKHGLPHTTLTLRTIAESSEGNQSALVADVIGAVSEVILSHPRWADLGLEWLAAFDSIDLAGIRKIVKTANVRPVRVGIATLICLDLVKTLGPSNCRNRPSRSG
jgi:hypothetical protein